MKYAPKKVFILENGKYKEITYSELQELEQSGKSYAEKFFLPLYGMLMEVTAETYKWYYKDKRRQKYIDEFSVKRRRFLRRFGHGRNSRRGSFADKKTDVESAVATQNDCGGTKKSVSSAFAR
ncbi:MAG: hypothetical protein ACLS4Z_02630 [Christensenellaceae bacterium]